MPQRQTSTTDAKFKKILAQIYEQNSFYVFHRYHNFSGFVKLEICLTSSICDKKYQSVFQYSYEFKSVITKMDSSPAPKMASLCKTIFSNRLNFPFCKQMLCIS